MSKVCHLLGTRAQLIKMAPVIKACIAHGLDCELLWTGQHKETFSDLLADFQLELPVVHLYEGPEVNSIGRVPRWAWQCLRNSRGSHRALFNSYSLIVTHGDTFSTVLAAWLGKKNGVPVAHIESGLRSFNLFDPFPEELCRLLVFRMSQVAYHPGEWAGKNLARYPLRKVDTVDNTIIDAVQLALSATQASEETASEYAICSIHRFENIFFKKRFLEIIASIEHAAQRCPIRFVLHPATRKRLTKYGLIERLQNNPRITLLERMGYVKFVRLLANAKFVITDGGSNQEELAHLGIPTLIMRKSTERNDGLGKIARLINATPAAIDLALDELRPLAAQSIPTHGPSEIIARDIVAMLQQQSPSR